MARTAGLILAAGRGTRFGGRKMLASVNGRPMLQHVLDLAAAAELDPVVVVLGEDAGEVERTLAWRSEIRVRNPDPGRGISSSVALGLAKLSHAERVLVLLGDQPLLSVENVSVITAVPGDPARPIIVPRYDGQPANPVLLERAAWPLAAELEGDRGMSQLFSAHPELVRYVDVTGSNPDIDTAEQLAAHNASAVVGAGYDALGSAYAEWVARVVDPARQPMLEDFMSRLPAGSAVLELGCGPGFPSTKQLAARFDVTGVDISPVQLSAARQNVPNARFIQADMTTLEFPDAPFDGVVALYSITHVPHLAHANLFGRIARWLRPGGLFLGTLSAEGGGDWSGEWLGVQTFFSGYDAIENRELLEQAGFRLLVDDVIEITEPEGPARFQWILATPERRAQP